MTSAQWQFARACCSRAMHVWLLEMAGTVFAPEVGAGGRDWIVLSAEDAPPGSPADDFGLVGAAIESRRVRIAGPDEILVEDGWDSERGRYVRSVRYDPTSDPTGQALRQASLIARHVLDGQPYRGRGGAPSGRQVDIGTVVATIIDLTAESVPSQEAVAAAVNYEDARSLQRAIGSPWADVLGTAVRAYASAAALSADERFDHLWQPWMGIWAWTRHDLERIAALGPYKDAKHQLLADAAHAAGRLEEKRWAKRHGVTIIRATVTG